jgi:hypothetical protein
MTIVACSRPATPNATTQPPQLPSANPTPAVEPPPSPAPAVASKPVKTEMRNVRFHFTDTAWAHIDTLSGTMLATGKNDMPDFNDKRSFEVRVEAGKMSITPQALGEIMNKFIFNKPDSPLKEVSVAIDKDKLVIKGKLNNKGFIPFQTVGTLSASPDGRLAIHTDKLKALHIPVKGMMGLFGMDLANVVNTSKIDGLEVDKDDLLMDLGKLLPPPHIIGKCTAVRLENGSIVTVLGEPSKAAAAEKTSYMSFEGGPVRFGNLLMEKADLTVLDLDPADALDWNQDHYKDQLVAGYSKITPNFGLRAYVKDFAKLPRSSGGQGAGAEKSSSDAAPAKP